MIKVVEIDGFKVGMSGGLYEALIYTRNIESVQGYILSLGYESSEVYTGDEIHLIRVSSMDPFDEDLSRDITNVVGVEKVRLLEPVLPIRSLLSVEPPFLTTDAMREFNHERQLALWELALEYESVRGGISKEKVWKKMESIAGIMKNAIVQGLEGTEYADRILGAQSVEYKKLKEGDKLLGGDTLNRIVMYVSAIMEVKSSMGVIVAAPTAGSCGAMPGAVFGVADSVGASHDDVIKALLSAGLIGLFIASQATFAAEVGGCQAECGAGATMAAAAIAQLGGGDLDTSIAAASMALQSSLGMICDPIGNRVEAPCLNRNVMAATNALSCANMALASYDHLIPLDQVIQTMYDVGLTMPSPLRCTNLGGLSITPAAKAIEERLGKDHGVVYKNC